MPVGRPVPLLVPVGIALDPDALPVAEPEALPLVLDPAPMPPVPVDPPLAEPDEVEPAPPPPALIEPLLCGPLPFMSLLPLGDVDGVSLVAVLVALVPEVSVWSGVVDASCPEPQLAVRTAATNKK